MVLLWFYSTSFPNMNLKMSLKISCCSTEQKHRGNFSGGSSEQRHSGRRAWVGHAGQRAEVSHLETSPKTTCHRSEVFVVFLGAKKQKQLKQVLDLSRKSQKQKTSESGNFSQNLRCLVQLSHYANGRPSNVQSLKHKMQISASFSFSLAPPGWIVPASVDYVPLITEVNNRWATVFGQTVKPNPIWKNELQKSSWKQSQRNLGFA